MAECLISIGSNLGNRWLVIETALAELQANPAISLRRTSQQHVTRPAGGPAGQDEFVNAAALVGTSLQPVELLDFLQSLESRAGRTRDVRWAARALDLDLLLYDDVVWNDERLVLPHPRMAFRRFVLAPAVEVAPNMPHPLLGQSMAQLLAHLDHAANYVAITGVPETAVTELARAATTRVRAQGLLARAPAAQQSEASGGRSVEEELELLHNRCDLIRNVAFTGQSPYAISDFWLEESLAHARELWPIEYHRVESAWLKRRQQVPAPKLLVFVEVTSDDDLCDRQKLSDSHKKSLLAVQRNLLEQMLAPGQPPNLRLNAANPTWNEEEVVAAILAMS
ncbi:MAG: 2-amino-4-hydroxy-6-hydroxymethyldihydropteridine diphosphokinase [Pirellulaceae bacterium]